MDENLKMILEKTRELTFKYGIKGVTFDKICEDLNITKTQFFTYIKDEKDLVEKVLDLEREGFKEIFINYDFEGKNAIDILLTVSKEVGEKFRYITPANTFELKKYYPEIYQKHFEERIEFIFGKIQINIQKGINQGMYREDLSIELIARLYISRLIDVHNTDIFPPDKYSFEVIFEVMFENFVRSIAKPEGIKYFEKRKKLKKYNV